MIATASFLGARSETRISFEMNRFLIFQQNRFQRENEYSSFLIKSSFAIHYPFSIHIRSELDCSHAILAFECHCFFSLIQKFQSCTCFPSRN